MILALFLISPRASLHGDGLPGLLSWDLGTLFGPGATYYFDTCGARNLHDLMKSVIGEIRMNYYTMRLHTSQCYWALKVYSEIVGEIFIGGNQFNLKLFRTAHRTHKFQDSEMTCNNVIIKTIEFPWLPTTIYTELVSATQSTFYCSNPYLKISCFFGYGCFEKRGRRTIERNTR